ncbi:MAG: hypothetical protein V4564_03155 [Pseudomonadota bacterium]|uniref:hypothetical protein n=1 Tax=Sphingomonas sp. ERG5 TaxID=1381597 RepID=UPI00054C3192|nr:hypothetical protein [Sphingomonas sp. ERG5]
MSNKAKALLAILAWCLIGFAAIVISVPAADHIGAPHWLVFAVAVVLPALLAKTVEHIWRRSA